MPRLPENSESEKEMSYKRQFIVKVTLTPGNGYEDSREPIPKHQRGAIRSALEKHLSPSGFIACKVNSVVAVKRK